MLRDVYEFLDHVMIFNNIFGISVINLLVGIVLVFYSRSINRFYKPLRSIMQFFTVIFLLIGLLGLVLSGVLNIFANNSEPVPEKFPEFMNLQSNDNSEKVSGKFDKYIIGAKSWNGHRYKAFAENISWENARKKCEDMGGHLATITSAEEQKIIESVVIECGAGYYWLGSRRINGKFTHWLDGEAIVYKNWIPTKPVSSKTNKNWDYMGMVNYSNDPSLKKFRGKLNQWIDLDNSTARMYVCEWDF